MGIRPETGGDGTDRAPRFARRTGPAPRARHDHGAVLAEFALLAPFLFLVIFGIVEFGWTFAQHLDARHAARETSRLAAVNYGEDLGDECGFPSQGPCTGLNQTLEIVAEACGRMNFVKPENARVRIDFRNDADPDGRRQGQFVVVEVDADLQQLTGFLDFALDGVTLSSEAETRIEHGVGLGPNQAVTYDETGSPQPAFIGCPT